MRVAVGERAAQKVSVGSEECHIHTPCVDAYALDVDATLCHGAQSAYYFVVKCEDVPIEVSAHFYEWRVESGYLFEFYVFAVELAHNRAAACCSKVC